MEAKKMHRIGALFSLLLCSLTVLADMSVYTLEARIRAAFPKQPEYIGELGQGNQRHRSYQTADETNLLAYALTYQVGRTIFKQKDVAEALRRYIAGQALVVGGIVESVTLVKIQGDEGAHFVVAYQLQGMSVRKYGAVMYRDGQFFQWTVQEFPGISQQSARSIFRAYVKDFSVK